MSRCDLRILLDRPDGTYKVGETIAGSAEVRVNEDVDCKALTLTLQWRTEGRGNTTKGKKTTTHLFSGPWRSGESLSYPFEVPAPYGPVTYRGEYLKVNHFLLARADIPWAMDPKAEERIVLESTADAPAECHLGQGYKDPDRAYQARHGAAGILVATIIALLMLGGGAALILLLEGREAWIGYVFGPTLGLLGLGVLWWAFRSRIAERKIGKVDFRIQPSTVRRGDAITCTVDFRPRTSVVLDRVDATLSAQEVVVRGGGKNSQTHRKVVHTEEIQLESYRQAMPGDDIRMEGVLTIPAEGPSTFHAPCNNVFWHVKVRVSIPGWPDWVRDHLLTVQP